MNFQNQTQITFLDTQSTFAKRNQINAKYLFDLPFDVRRSFCNLLDADQSWRELGGKFIGLNETDLELYSHAIMRNQSPTNTMLSKWEQSNITIEHLFKCLALMKHLRAMSILKPFVDARLHHLCDYDELKTIVTLTEAKENQITNGNYSGNNQRTPQQVDNNDHKELEARREADLTNVKKKPNVKLNQAYQMPSHFKNSFSAVASTINAYDDNVPYEEILAATNNFHISNVIGSGGFGVVYKGHWNGTKVAIKRLKDCGNFSQALTELRALSEYRIDNIVPLYGVSIGRDEACLVYQFLVNGSLDDRLQCKRNSQPLTWPQRINIGLGIAKALNYLHTRGKGKALIHGDVKSANILLDAQMHAKLGDFGLAKYLQDYQSSNQQSSMSDQSSLNPRKRLTHITVTSVHGTVAYLPLEYLRSKILSPAVDVYSYAIVLLEMLTGRRAFDGKSLLLDKVMDELEEAFNSKTISKHCELLGEFGNLIGGPKTANTANRASSNADEHTAPSIIEKMSSGCICVSCRMFKLHDSKLPQTFESVFWFHCILKLALDCSNKLKLKRPAFATILHIYEAYFDQFKQFQACNQLFNLTGINTNRSSIASRASTFKAFKDDDAIKTPLEFRLWNDLKRKNASETPPVPESNLTNESNESNYQQTDQSARHSDQLPQTEEELLISLSINRLNLAEQSGHKLNLVDSITKYEPSINHQQSSDQQGECFNEFAENCNLPLLTELGVRTKHD